MESGGDWVAARRVVEFSNKNKELNCPTDHFPPFDNKQQNKDLSNPNPHSAFNVRANPDHESLCRSLSCCLTLGSFEAWQDFALIAMVRLGEKELAALSYSCLKALCAENAERVAAARLKAAGSPLPAFLGGMADARFWASICHQSELKAYLVAAFEALPQSDQQAFLDHVAVKGAAA